MSVKESPVVHIGDTGEVARTLLKKGRSRVRIPEPPQMVGAGKMAGDFRSSGIAHGKTSAEIVNLTAQHTYVKDM